LPGFRGDPARIRKLILTIKRTRGECTLAGDSIASCVSIEADRFCLRLQTQELAAMVMGVRVEHSMAVIRRPFLKPVAAVTAIPVACLVTIV